MDRETEETIKAYDINVDEYSKRWHGHIDKVAPSIEKMLKLTKGKKVLDVGCGTGRDCNYLDSRGYDVTGVDLSEKMIENCKKNYPQIKFLKMDMRNISFPDGSFDAIHCWSVIQHVKKEEALNVLKEFNRILKKEGALLIATREGSFEGYRKEMYDSQRWFTYYEKPFFESLLKEAGFEVVEIEDDYKEEKGKKIKINHFICKKV